MSKADQFRRDICSRSLKGRFKLPTGQTIRSNNPVNEFSRNVKARYTMLFDEEMFDELHLVELWENDALTRRKGKIGSLDRANALGFDLAALRAFDDRVKELELTVWKKAADFYRGLKASGIFEQTILVYGGVYRDHDVWSWEEIQTKFGVSRETFLRRLKADVALTDLFSPARTKHPTTLLEVDGSTYTPRKFATAFGLPMAHVRDGIEQNLSANQILRAPRKRRGRPKKVISALATREPEDVLETLHKRQEASAI
jgi:AraC-like DNA-binding protein